MRVHVGNISPQLAENIDDLMARLEKYGKIQSKPELLRKEMLETFFLYVDIDIDQDKFKELRKALNGLKFRQSTLSIQEAKPKWTFEPSTQQNALNADQIKRNKSHLHEINVFKGKMRTHPRPAQAIRELTLRLKYPDGKVRKIQGHKSRLWGYEKKLPQNLVYEFSDGEWKDFTGRPVEIAVRNEQDRNTRVVENINAGYLSDSDFEEFRHQIDENAYNGNYEDDDMEIVVDDGPKQSFPANSDSDTDDEFYKNTVPAAVAPTTAEVEAPVAEVTEQRFDEKLKVNNTEKLRDVLAAPSSFSLFGGPQEADEQEEEVAPIAVSAPVVRKFGLFFLHSESPFLQTQAQVLKLHRNFDPEEWEKTFWENRGDLNRQLRTRRREEARTLRKRGINIALRTVEL